MFNTSIIEKEVYNHYQFFQKNYEKEIFGTFLYGSQNYNFAHDKSDIDTRTFRFPTMTELSLNQEVRNTTYFTDDSMWHMDLQDIRFLFNNVLKQGFNTLELFYTHFRTINADYTKIWWDLEANREKIAHYNPRRAVNSFLGAAKRNLNVIKNSQNEDFPLGYNSKALATLVRLCEAGKKYMEDAPYSSVLVVDNYDYLYSLREEKREISEVMSIATSAFTELETLFSIYDPVVSDSVKDEVEMLLAHKAEQLMEKYLKAVLV